MGSGSLPGTDVFRRLGRRVGNRWGWPNDANPLTDYGTALNGALDSPLGAQKLECQVGPGSTVAIIVDDPSRWTPVSDALLLVLSRLHTRGVKPADATISLGVGRHRPVAAEIMAHRLSTEIAATYQCLNPPVDELSV